MKILFFHLKIFNALSFLGLLTFITSCQTNSNCDEVVCETVHRYGVPLEQEDWSERGKNGQIISMRNDGVRLVRNYDTGILEGECTYSFPHRDVVQRREIYHQGNLAQEWTNYPNGLPQQQIIYDTPDDQSVVVWYENGAPQAQEHLQNGHIIDGEYFDLNHHIESRIESSNGIRTCRNGLGQLESTDTVRDGQMVLRTTYFPNGMPSAYTPYANDIIEGQRRTFDLGGEPIAIEDWTKNQQHGTTTLFEHGEKWSDVPYVNGFRNGIEHRYRNGETIEQDVTWVDGFQHGPSYSYVNGTMQTEWYYKGNRVPNKATFDMLTNQ